MNEGCNLELVEKLVKIVNDNQLDLLEVGTIKIVKSRHANTAQLDLQPPADVEPEDEDHLLFYSSS